MSRRRNQLPVPAPALSLSDLAPGSHIIDGSARRAPRLSSPRPSAGIGTGDLGGMAPLVPSRPGGRIYRLPRQPHSPPALSLSDLAPGHAPVLGASPRAPSVPVPTYKGGSRKGSAASAGGGGAPSSFHAGAATPHVGQSAGSPAFRARQQASKAAHDAAHAASSAATTPPAAATQDDLNKIVDSFLAGQYASNDIAQRHAQENYNGAIDQNQRLQQFYDQEAGKLSAAPQLVTQAAAPASQRHDAFEGVLTGSGTNPLLAGATKDTDAVAAAQNANMVADSQGQAQGTNAFLSNVNAAANQQTLEAGLRAGRFKDQQLRDLSTERMSIDAQRPQIAYGLQQSQYQQNLANQRLMWQMQNAQDNRDAMMKIWGLREAGSNQRTMYGQQQQNQRTANTLGVRKDIANQNAGIRQSTAQNAQQLARTKAANQWIHDNLMTKQTQNQYDPSGAHVIGTQDQWVPRSGAGTPGGYDIFQQLAPIAGPATAFQDAYKYRPDTFRAQGAGRLRQQLISAGYSQPSAMQAVGQVFGPAVQHQLGATLRGIKHG